MSDGNFNRNPNAKPPNVLNEFALRLNGEPINGGKRPPSLMVNVKRDGKSGPWGVLFETRTNVEGDKDYGKISFNLALPEMFLVLSLIEKWVKATEKGFDKVELHNRRFIRNQNAMSKEPMFDGSITVGRTESGQIYIGIKAWDNERPVCKFVLKPVVDFRRAVKLFKSDGTEWDAGALSQVFASAWATAMTKIVTQVYTDEFTPAPPRENQGGGGGGGGNRYGGGGNNGGNRGGGGGWNGNNSGGGNSGGGSGNSGGASDWGDDDIPM
ncbi:hypothetical protein LUCX_72 [Xanthomonas phage vB_XciM_LucasX]|nr:hypothetical protein LUCX_72 [Xanthomonas phage vB_XciM_LucasX]